MNWIIGLDLRPRGEGAIQFASWLAASSRAAGGAGFVPVHVFEEEHLRTFLRYHHLDELTAAAREAARAALAPLAKEGISTEPEIVQALLAEEGLAEACRARRADGILIGRAGRREGGGLVRLGRVARRLARTLPAPLIVAPPDLTRDDLGDGPIIALTRLVEDSSACTFGAAFAAATGRPLLVAHVVEGTEHMPYVPRATHERIAQERLAEAKTLLERWIAAHGLHPADTALERGPVIERAIALAAERRSPLLVVGSRRTSPGGAVFAPSLARELAAASKVPVALVPPHW